MSSASGSASRAGSSSPGSSPATCRAAYARHRVETDPVDDSWLAAHQEGIPPTDADVLAWMRSRPESVKALMRRFPPACVVKANRPLRIPRPGEYAIVRSYTEDGGLSVIRGGDDPAPVRAFCDANWLEPVAYHRGMTPEWVARVLSE